MPSLPSPAALALQSIRDRYNGWTDPVISFRDALRRDAGDVETWHELWTGWLQERGVRVRWLKRLAVDDPAAGVMKHVTPPFEFDVPPVDMFGDAEHCEAARQRMTLRSMGAAYWKARHATVIGGWDVVVTSRGANWPALSPDSESVLVSNALDARLLGWTPSFLVVRDEPAPRRRFLKWFTRRHRRLDRAIMLVGEHSWQYGHWMLDYLPRALAVRDLPRDTPVLVDARVPRNSLWWLQAVLPGRRILLVEEREAVAVRTLFVPLQRTFCPTGWIDSMELTPDVWSIDPQAVAELQRISAPSRRRLVRRTERLFLGRKGGNRLLVNQDQLIASLTPHGFKVVYLEDFTMPRVQTLLDGARDIVAPGGAQLLNLAVARPGLRLLALIGYDVLQARSAVVAPMAAAGHESALVVGTRLGSPGRNPYEDSQRPYAMDAAVVAGAVQAFFRDAGSSPAHSATPESLG